jgi:hypothetical protein
LANFGDRIYQSRGFNKEPRAKKAIKSDKFSERWIALPAQAVQTSCLPMALAIREAEDDTSAAYSVMYVDAYYGSTLY